LPVGVLGVGIVTGQGLIAHLDGEGAPGDLDDGCFAEVLTEAAGIDRGRRDDDLEVGALRLESPQVSQQEIDVEAALVRLVDDDGVVRPQVPIPLRLGEQDAVGHDLEETPGAGALGEAHLVADVATQGAGKLLGDAGRHAAGGDPPGLRVPDQGRPAPSQLEADLRQLGRLAGPGLAADDDDLVRGDRVGDLLPLRGHGQFGRVGETPGPVGVAASAKINGGRDLLGQPPSAPAGGRAPGGGPLQAAQAPAQAILIGQHALVELLRKPVEIRSHRRERF
jgi:hypothetical protein